MYENRSLIDKMKTFDIYKKLPKEYLQPTCVGALLTIFTFILSIYLFFFEFSRYFQYKIKSEMLVDLSQGSDQLPVSFDITFNRLPCTVLSLDLSDQIGGHSANLEGNIIKKELDERGKVINGNYKNNITDREQLFRKFKNDLAEKRGCKVSGEFTISRVPGNFHFSSHPYGDILQRMVRENHNFKPNLTHTIHSLSFGKEISMDDFKHEFNMGIFGPLDGVSKTDNKYQNIFHYYLQIVPTKFIRLNGNQYNSYQCTVNTNVDRSPTNFPAVMFRYDISPILVKYTQIKPNMLDAVVNICAIFGGMFSVAGIFDMLILRFFKKSSDVKST